MLRDHKIICDCALYSIDIKVDSGALENFHEITHHLPHRSTSTSNPSVSVIVPNGQIMTSNSTTNLPILTLPQSIKHEAELELLEYSVCDLGTHLIRKGAATYASSGTTAAPAAVAINLRGGWKMGGVWGTYLCYERARNRAIGRIVCGVGVGL